MSSSTLSTTALAAVIIGMFSIVFAGDDGSASRPAGATSEAGAEEDGFRLDLAAGAAERTSYEPVCLKIKLVNVGAGPVWVANPQHSDTYRVEVYLPGASAKDGAKAPEKAPLTLYGQSVISSRRYSGSNQTTKLEAGQSVECEIRQLNQLYDMTLKGAYTITVRRLLPSRRHPGENVDLVSNAVHVTMKELPDTKNDGLADGTDEASPQSGDGATKKP